ncbi:MAG TPA: SBBP repeat-containing protein, partial [Bryobacteraceae bacterium]
MTAATFNKLARTPGKFAGSAFPAAFLAIAVPFLLTAANPAISASYGKLPLSFEENRGQAPSGVSYLSRIERGAVYLRRGSVALESGGATTIAMRFVGAAPVAPEGEQKLPGITSYLIGDKREWIRDVPNYASVRYAAVYPGIDAVFHGNNKQLEYDFVLRPGADPNRIRIAFEGVKRVHIDAQGDLELIAARGTMKQRKPKIWQKGALGEREVAGRYVLSGPAEAHFELDSYDRQSTLVIDPVIDYASYFGSARDDRAQAIATDATGAAYIAGSTATGGISWGFVSKLNPGGTAVVYTAYIGSGVCNASVRGIAVDSADNAIVTGYYTQTDQSGNCTKKQVLGAKLNPAGNAFAYELVWGGVQDYGNAVAVDGAGNAYFTGSTAGGMLVTAGVVFPTGGYQGDAFVTKFGPAGAVLYSTYLGGPARDEGLAIAVDTAGNAYVAGSTASSNFPVTANAVQATIPNATQTGFITEVNSTATQLLYSSFLGGNRAESVTGVAVGLGKIHVTGHTTSGNFPTTANAWDRVCGTDGACNTSNDDAFYSKIDPARVGTAALLYSTFLGGANRDLGEAIALDPNGRAWIAGRTASTDFPMAHPAQAVSGGNYDAFLVHIDPAQPGALSLLFSTFLGGSLYEEGTGITVDPLGDIYAVGYTGSTNFPVISPIQPQSAGGNDGFIVKIAASPGATLNSVAVNPGTVTGGAGSTGTVTLSTAAPAGGTVVMLATSNTNVATVPSSVTVAAGATAANFAVTTHSVTAGTVATITATYNGVAKTVGLAVNPLLASITLNPVVLTGGAGSIGTVTLSSAAPAGGALVALTSANTNAASVPASVTVTAGATSATFALTTKAVKTVTSVNITATSNGAARIVTLTVNPPLASATVNPASVTGGTGSTGTVRLSSAAPAAGAVVTLASSNTNVATVPASVTVAAGATNATFAITTKAVTTTTVMTITATYNGAAQTATLTVNPPAAALAAIAVNPTAVTGGAASTGTVTLGTAAPAGGAVVTL